MTLRPQLSRVIEARETLSRDEARQLMEQMLTEPPPEVETAALLGAMGARGETAEEIAGFVDAMRRVVTTLPLEPWERELLVDTCGTGGDASGTFNISTAAALVAAAAGATVAKHGNRAVTSRCGSADVLEALGIPVDMPALQAVDSLREHRFVFLHAPSMHPAMRAMMPVRRAMGVRTVFNLLGPLTNPAGASRQLMGVYGSAQVEVVAEAMSLLGTRRSMVVHGETGAGSGMDELSVSGRSVVGEVRDGEVSMTVMEPESAGVGRAGVEELRGGDAAENASILRGIFAGERGGRRDVVVLNAAAVLVVAGLAKELKEGAERAAEVIDSGKVTELVEALARRG